MTPLTLRPLMSRRVFFGFLGGLAILLSALDAKAQGDAKAKADAKPQASAKRHSIVRDGFTRPGNPPDVRLPNGNIRYVAWDPANREDVIGGTVYWMVLEQTGSDTDSWRTGIARFNDAFREGKDFQNRFSPALDVN